MKQEPIEIKSKINGNITAYAIPGHFATAHAHVNFYIDVTNIKHQHTMARNAAIAFASFYASNTVVDTIVCTDNSEVIGAFLARELTRPSYMSVNDSTVINVVAPEFTPNGQMMFRDNIKSMVNGKNILLLISSVITGKTLARSFECISYYGGAVSGIAAISSSMEEFQGISIHSIFSPSDLPEYNIFSAQECPFCKSHRKIDALSNSHGYTEL